ncbi:MAG: DUF1934 domain-containing protein [Lachnospiraceae bacterium]|nr:DUF1934 domain-containing protein [Lachnospiraceae bacterium]
MENIKREVDLTITGKQRNADDSDSSVVKVKGTLSTVNGKTVVFYEEISEDGDKFKCLLKFDENSLEHSKTGEVKSKFIFKKGWKYLGTYQTPFGDFEMGTDTKFYEMSECEGKINLHAIYDMEINNEFASENEILIEIS